MAVSITVHRVGIGLAATAGALFFTYACGTGSLPKVDDHCAAPGDIELKVIRDFEPNALACDDDDSAAPSWFASGDDTGLFQPPLRLPTCEAGTATDAGAEDGGPVDGGPVDGGPVDGGPVDAAADSDASDASDAPPPRAQNVTESACVRMIEDPVCPTPEATHQKALVLRTHGHNDWGTLFGDYALAGSTNNFVQYWPAVGTGYEGIAIIAKSPGNHDKAVTLLLDDTRTTRLTVPEGGFPAGSPVEGLEAGPGECTVMCTDPNTTVTLDPATGNVISQSTVPPAGSCGNSFRRILQVTDKWRLYLLPFNTFVQDRYPNASATGIDPSQIRRIVIRSEKEANLELWIDEIAFYRRMSPNSPSTPDASQ